MSDPITRPTPAEVWRNAEPSFRGAVIGAMQERARDRALVIQDARDIACGDPDVLALLERTEAGLRAELAAIEILREAAK